MRTLRLPAALAALLAISLLAAACLFKEDDGSSERPPASSGASPQARATAPRSTPTPEDATPSPSPTPDAPPDRPEQLSAYGPAVAEYLSEGKEPRGCPDQLFDAWEIPIPSDQRCVQADTDADGNVELVLALTPPIEEEFPIGLPIAVAILHQNGTEWSLAYQTPDDPDLYTSSTVEGGPGDVLVAVRDLNGQPGAEVAYRLDSCGAHTCYTTIEVLGWDGAAYAELTHDNVSTSFADVSIEDRDGDDVAEIVLHGGSIGSVGAGPTRTRTDVYAWDGSGWRLTETINDASAFLYHAILDADDTFAAGDYASASVLYESAIADPELTEWKEDGSERPELAAYALFRIAMADIAVGGEQSELDAALLEAVQSYPGTLHAEMARAFRSAWVPDGDAAAGCASALAYVQENLDAFSFFWDFGYGNPPFVAENLCPF